MEVHWPVLGKQAITCHLCRRLLLTSILPDITRNMTRCSFWKNTNKLKIERQQGEKEREREVERELDIQGVPER